MGTCRLTGDDGAPTVGHLLALQLGQLGLVPALLAGEGAALLVGDLVTLGAGRGDALLLAHCHVAALLLRDSLKYQIKTLSFSFISF